MYRTIIYAIPLFALLIACEFAWGCLRGRNTYRLNDFVSNLSHGLLSQVVAVCTPFLQIGFYTMVFPFAARWSNPEFWSSWTGIVLAVILFDFCNYWVHRAGHECAVFWAAHAVHHQSQDFNLSVALRQGSAVSLLGWIFFLPMALIGVPPRNFGIAALVLLVYGYWVHTQHIGKLGWFDHVFSSPSNHRVHHAINAEYLDRNYGALLMVWDKLFGTFAEERATCVYGTLKPLNTWNPLRALFGLYMSLASAAWRTPRWSDKFLLWFKAPGWQPGGVTGDVSGEVPADHCSGGAAAPYDPVLAPAQQWTAISQLVLWLAVILAFLWQAQPSSYAVNALMLGASITGLWLTGAVLDSTLRVHWAWVMQAIVLGLVLNCVFDIQNLMAG
ncbi:sterol desaturase family protein [Variovorax atrisoli]|uniref:sterol desaturase family protein n=1 Tax=Variovorax atrisoli TaxID=3394203 RepID=UPI00404025F5